MLFSDTKESWPNCQAVQETASNKMTRAWLEWRELCWQSCGEKLVEHLLPAWLAPAATSRFTTFLHEAVFVLKGMKQSHTIFPRHDFSFKYLKAAERTHQNIKKMKHSYQDTTMTFYTEDADFLCGYDQKVCWVLRNNFFLTAYKSIFIRLCCQRIYYFKNTQVW